VDFLAHMVSDQELYALAYSVSNMDLFCFFDYEFCLNAPSTFPSDTIFSDSIVEAINYYTEKTAGGFASFLGAECRCARG